MAVCRSCGHELPRAEQSFVNAYAGVPQGDPFPFCPDCGAFQLLVAAPRLDLPESALQFQSLMRFRDELPATGTPLSLGQKLAARQQFEAATKGSPFSPAAVQQYTQELEPLVVSGRADAAFVEQVAQYWIRAAALVSHMNKLLKDAAEAEKAYPVQATVFQKLRAWAADAAKSAMQAVVSEGSTYKLHQRALELEWALGECQMAAYRISAYMRLRRAKDMGCDFGIGLRLHGDLFRDDAWLRHVRKQAEIRLNREYWLPGEDEGAAIFSRYKALSASMADALVAGDGLQLPNWHVWLVCKAAVIGKIPRFMLCSREMKEFLEMTTEAVEAAIAKGPRDLFDAVDKEISGVKESEERWERMEEARQSRQREQENAAQLAASIVWQQQAARQMSEGKFWSALVTANWGTNAGATFEGLSK